MDNQEAAGQIEEPKRFFRKKNLPPLVDERCMHPWRPFVGDAVVRSLGHIVSSRPLLFPVNDTCYFNSSTDYWEGQDSTISGEILGVSFDRASCSVVKKGNAQVGTDRRFSKRGVRECFLYL